MIKSLPLVRTFSRVLPHEASENAADFTYSYTYTAKNDRETVTLPSGGNSSSRSTADGSASTCRGVRPAVAPTARSFSRSRRLTSTC